MRRFRGDTRQCIGGLFPATAVNAQNINIHVTNVTQVVSVHAKPHAFPRQYSQRRPNADFHRKPHTCPPKLFRYCASGGLLDSGIASRMSSGEMCVEAAKVCGYSACRMGQSVGRVADHTISAAGHAVSMVGGLCSLVGAMSNLVKACFKE